MKNKMLCITGILLGMLFFVSCNEEIGKEELSDCYPYTFSGFDVKVGVMDELTRATKAGDFSFLAVDVVDDKYVQSISRISYPDALADVTMNLTVGSHKVYFIYAAKPWESFDEEALIVHWNEQHELGETWGAVADLEVEGPAKDPVNVSLKHIVAYARTKMTDALPASLSKVRLDLAGGSWSYNLLQQTGCTAESLSRIVQIPAAYIGQKDVILGIFSFVPAGVAQSPLYTVTAYDASSNLLSTHSFENVPMVVNQFVLYQGQFFTPQSTGFQLSYDENWNEKYENF